MTAKKANAKKTSKKPSSDEIIEGEVVDIAQDEAAMPSQDAPADEGNQIKRPKSRFPLGMFSAVILSISALALSSYFLLDSLERHQAIEERLSQHMADTEKRAAVIEKRLAAIALLETEITGWQERFATQDEAITNLSEMVTRLSAPQDTNAQVPVKGIVAMAMWQDMKDGQSLSDYQLLLASLPDGAPALGDVITKWQALDYQNMLQEGYALLGGTGSARVIEPSVDSDDQSGDTGIMSRFTNWIARTINLTPLEDKEQEAAKPSITDSGNESAPARSAVIGQPSFDVIYNKLITDASPQAASWVERADKVRFLQDELLSLSVSWLANQEPSS